jgi:uncharacterized cupredoxin-like copper-binding protein
MKHASQMLHRSNTKPRQGGEMSITKAFRAITAVAVASWALVACASPGSSPTASAAAEGNVVAVTLQEFAVLPSPSSASAGEITFQVTNDGPEDIHEFVILRTDLDTAELPTDEHGAVSEDGEGIEVIDEIEDIPVGETQEVTVTLEAGNYVLLCNIFDEDEDEAHYMMGMRVAFPVS